MRTKYSIEDSLIGYFILCTNPLAEVESICQLDSMPIEITLTATLAITKVTLIRDRGTLIVVIRAIMSVILIATRINTMLISTQGIGIILISTIRDPIMKNGRIRTHQIILENNFNQTTIEL